jgi:hypothetical protein
MNMTLLTETFFHGTSSALGISDELLPPGQTLVLSEAGRLRNLDKVFFTADEGSARIYAAKAVKRFGGKPVVLKVRPKGSMVVLQASKGTTVFMADSATIHST